MVSRAIWEKHARVSSSKTFKIWPLCDTQDCQSTVINSAEHLYNYIFNWIFQETTTSTVHDIGAVLTFIAAACYCTTQTFTTWKLYCFNIDDRLSWIYRLTITCIMMTAGSLFLLFSLFAYEEFEDSHPTHTILQWDQKDGGYNLHVFSNVSEWIGVTCFLLFLVSYFNEFQEINIVTKCIPRSSNCIESVELEKLQESS